MQAKKRMKDGRLIVRQSHKNWVSKRHTKKAVEDNGKQKQNIDRNDSSISNIGSKTAVDEILERKLEEIIEKRRHEDVFTRHISGRTGMRHHRQNGCSPACTYAQKVNNSLHNYETPITKMKDRCKADIVKDRQNILMENEDNQTVLHAKKVQRGKCWGVDEKSQSRSRKMWIYRARQVDKGTIYMWPWQWGLENKTNNEIKDKSKTDIVTSKQVLVLAKQEEANMIQRRGPEQMVAETMRTSMCKYCGSSHTPRRCPAYGMMCGKCSQVNNLSAVCRAPRQGWSREKSRAMDILIRWRVTNLVIMINIERHA